MIFRPLLAWTISAAVLAYTPTAQEILLKMSATLRKTPPVETKVIREDPDGDFIEEVLLTVPGRAGSTKNLKASLDLPYAMITLPAEELREIFPSIASTEAMVNLGRLNGKVCYILEGKDERLWVSKNDLIPLKVEILSEKRLGTHYLYLNMVKLSEKAYYPSRTEVWRDGELILVERLVPAATSTEEP